MNLPLRWRKSRLRNKNRPEKSIWGFRVLSFDLRGWGCKSKWWVWGSKGERGSVLMVVVRWMVVGVGRTTLMKKTAAAPLYPKINKNYMITPAPLFNFHSFLYQINFKVYGKITIISSLIIKLCILPWPYFFSSPIRFSLALSAQPMFDHLCVTDVIDHRRITLTDLIGFVNPINWSELPHTPPPSPSKTSFTSSPSMWRNFSLLSCRSNPSFGVSARRQQ